MAILVGFKKNHTWCSECGNEVTAEDLDLNNSRNCPHCGEYIEYRPGEEEWTIYD